MGTLVEKEWLSLRPGDEVVIDSAVIQQAQSQPGKVPFEAIRGVFRGVDSENFELATFDACVDWYENGEIVETLSYPLQVGRGFVGGLDPDYYPACDIWLVRASGATVKMLLNPY